MSDERKDGLMLEGTIYVAWSEVEPVIHPPPLCADCDGTGRFIGKAPELGLNLDFAPCTTCDGTGEATHSDAGEAYDPVNPHAGRSSRV